jgi:hypothetical protein
MLVVIASLLLSPLSSNLALAQDEVPAEAPAETVVTEPALAEEPVYEEPAAEPVYEEPAAEPVYEEPAQQAAPAPGSLEIRLTGSTGVALSGLFAVYDATGTYHERWTDNGVAWFSDLTPGTATIYQVSGTTDFAFDSTTPGFIEVPSGGNAQLPIVNAFLDADGDAIGDSVDICAAGNDAVDTDTDGTPDACDPTPNGDTDGDGIDELSDPTPNGDDDADGVDNAVDSCPAGDDAIDTDANSTPDACDAAPNGGDDGGDNAVDACPSGGDANGTPDACENSLESTPVASPTADETSEIVAAVAEEPVVVEEAPVTCQAANAVSPWIVTDLDDYPPGGLVTLTGSNWVAGQVIEILVEDDGLADAEQGPWSHVTTVTADDEGNFTYQFNLAPWYVADYSVVATGECSEASTTFTDAYLLSASLNPMQVQFSSSITYSMTVANANTGSEATNTVANNLGCVRISLATNGANGYTAPFVAQSVFAPGGKSWSVATYNTNSATMYIIATANNDSSKLAPNEQLTIGFSATTPANQGLSPITVTGRTSTASPCEVGGAAFNTQTFNVNVVGANFSAAASINPSIVGLSTVQTYTVRVSNNGSGVAALMGSAKVLIPDGFSGPTAVSVSGNASWTATYSSSEGKILVNSVNNPVSPGGFIDVTFTSTAPASAGPRTFTVEAWTGTGFGGNQFGFASQPLVTVVAPTTTSSTLTRNPNQSTVFGATVTFTATVTPASGTLNGGTVIFKDGTTVLCNAVALSGNTATCATSNLSVGTHSITAEYSGTTTGSPQFGASTSAALSHTVTQISQTITFAPLVDKTFGDAPFTVSATASSGLAVAFAASGPCTVAGTTVTITGAGTCTITAAQGGNTNYNPATSVARLFQIAARPVTVTADPQTKVFGTADPALTYKITSGSLVGTDTFTGALTRAVGETVGTYAIQQGTLALGSNYTLTFVSANLTITAAPLCTPTVTLAGGSLDFGTLTWTGTNYPTGTAALAIQISSSGTGCSGFPASWSIQASTSVMNGTGGGTIPAEAISFTGTSGSAPADLTPSSAKPLGSAQTIATGNASTAAGTWTAGFSIAPPNTAPPGTYTGTITITVSSAGS